jgi:AAA+ ATPase superfamily predicted ATPase
MTNFIGREEELSFLNNHYNSKAGELIIIYGRRRIGKTETISHFCADKNPVFLLVLRQKIVISLKISARNCFHLICLRVNILRNSQTGNRLF